MNVNDKNPPDTSYTQSGNSIGFTPDQIEKFLGSGNANSDPQNISIKSSNQKMTGGVTHVKWTSLMTRELKKLDDKQDDSKALYENLVNIDKFEQGLQCAKAAVERNINAGLSKKFADFLTEKKKSKQDKDNVENDGLNFEIETQKHWSIPEKNGPAKCQNYPVVRVQYKGLDLCFYIVDGGRNFGLKNRCELCVDCSNENIDARIVYEAVDKLLKMAFDENDLSQGFITLPPPETSIGYPYPDEFRGNTKFLADKRGRNGRILTDSGYVDFFSKSSERGPVSWDHSSEFQKLKQTFEPKSNVGDLSQQLPILFKRASYSISEVDSILGKFTEFYKQAIDTGIAEKAKERHMHCISRLEAVMELFEAIVEDEGSKDFLCEKLNKCLNGLKNKTFENSSGILLEMTNVLSQMLEAVILSADPKKMPLRKMFIDIIRGEVQDATWALMSNDLRFFPFQPNDSMKQIWGELTIEARDDGNFHFVEESDESNFEDKWKYSALRKELFPMPFKAEDKVYSWWNAPYDSTLNNAYVFLKMRFYNSEIARGYVNSKSKLHDAIFESQGAQDSPLAGILTENDFELYFGEINKEDNNSKDEKLGSMGAIYDMCHRVTMYNFLENVRKLIKDDEQLRTLMKLNPNCYDNLKKYFSSKISVDLLNSSDGSIKDEEQRKIIKNFTEEQRKILAKMPEDIQDKIGKVFCEDYDGLYRQVYDYYYYELALMFTQIALNNKKIENNEEVIQDKVKEIYEYLKEISPCDRIELNGLGPKRGEVGQEPGNSKKQDKGTQSGTNVLNPAKDTSPSFVVFDINGKPRNEVGIDPFGGPSVTLDGVRKGGSDEISQEDLNLLKEWGINGQPKIVEVTVGSETYKCYDGETSQAVFEMLKKKVDEDNRIFEEFSAEERKIDNVPNLYLETVKFSDSDQQNFSEIYVEYSMFANDRSNKIRNSDGSLNEKNLRKAFFFEENKRPYLRKEVEIFSEKIITGPAYVNEKINLLNKLIDKDKYYLDFYKKAIPFLEEQMKKKQSEEIQQVNVSNANLTLNKGRTKNDVHFLNKSKVQDVLKRARQALKQENEKDEKSS